MGRYYSKKGCVICKSRKKKCGEEKPVCQTCVRLGLPCSYKASTTTSKAPYRSATTGNLGSAQILSPASITRLLHTATQFSCPTEEGILARIPQSCKEFFSPACGVEACNLSTVWQLMFQDHLVRSAVVACFSITLGSTPEYGRLNRAHYGWALRLLRYRLSRPQLSHTDTLTLRLATQFLSLIDPLLQTVGPEEPADVLQHWRGLASLIAAQLPSDRSEEAQVSLAGRNVVIFQYEGLAYHVSLAMFCADVSLIRTLWRKVRVFEVLRNVNPDTGEYMARSPFVFGQYDGYELLLEVIYLHRLLALQPCQPEQVQSLQTRLQGLEKSIADSIQPALLQADCSKEKRDAIVAACRLHNVALFIMIEALRPPTAQVGRKIDSAVECGFRILAEMPTVAMCYATMMWPVNLLALATRSEEGLRRLDDVTSAMRAMLDPGHHRRYRAVAEVVRASITDGQRIIKVNMSEERLSLHTSTQADDSYLPPGFLLLRKKDGILS